MLTGVCTSLCQTNFDLLSEAWVDRLIEMGVMYCWFHIYRVVGPAPTPDLALTPAQLQQLGDTLHKVLGAKVSIDAQVNPDILGGLVVKVGSRLFDSSIRSKLARLQLAMKGVA